jgi:transcriptional regulator with GAF, ATPase, and Fis domain
MLHAARTSQPQHHEQRYVSEGELRYELLSDIAWMIGREVDFDKLLGAFSESVARAMNAERATLWLVERQTRELRSHIAHEPELAEKLRVRIGHGVAGYVAETGRSVNVGDVATDQRWAPEFDQKTGYQTRSIVCVPIFAVKNRGTLRGVLQVLNKRAGTFTREDEEFLSSLAKQVARALHYTTLDAEGSSPGVPIPGRFNHVIGDSAAMQSVYSMIVRAAATDATVLLSGETGTGKGLMARAIHVNSARREGPLVLVDCTNLPANLVESELFGHERGAYTGADSRVHGKVEMAGGGTLFLDELGEMPLELQGKFLRFLQERRFERVGGRQTIESDARIVAATNRDLAELVKNGQFRADLYYRVRVIDIELPPLRGRGDRDVLALAEHFVRKYSRRYRKTTMVLADDTREALSRHTWPGNVRELEHTMERAVVLAAGQVIDKDALALVPAERVRVAADTGPDTSRNTRRDASADAGGVLIEHGLPLADVERRYATAELERASGNRSAASRSLSISRNRLARLLSAGDSTDADPEASDSTDAGE